MFNFDIENKKDETRFLRLGEMIAAHKMLHDDSLTLRCKPEIVKLFDVIYLYLERIRFRERIKEDVDIQGFYFDKFVLIYFLGSEVTDIEGISASYDTGGDIRLAIRKFDVEASCLYFERYYVE